MDGSGAARVGGWVLLGALGLAAATLLIDRRSEPAVPTELVEQKLSGQVRLEGRPLRGVYCVRSERLPRAFDCFGEGGDDIQTAYRVTVRPDGSSSFGSPRPRPTRHVGLDAERVIGAFRLRARLPYGGQRA